MYYPIQIPYILNETFKKNILYSEESINEYEDFVICFWEMKPVYKSSKNLIDNIILPDGCIDLVVNMQTKQIGFSGFSQTNFNFEISSSVHYWGIRFKPGAFYQLTNIPAIKAMDNFISLDIIDPMFNVEAFFSLSFDDGKEFIKTYLLNLIDGLSPSYYVTLFDNIFDNKNAISAIELYNQLNFSPRQCQRLFLKQYGITPKMVLSVIRFQQSLKILTSKDASQSDSINIVGYYDQPHYIKDIKKNIGIAPLQLLKKYQ